MNENNKAKKRSQSQTYLDDEYNNKVRIFKVLLESI